MKIKIFDTAFNNPSDPTVNVYFELTNELTRLQKEEKAVIKARMQILQRQLTAKKQELDEGEKNEHENE